MSEKLILLVDDEEKLVELLGDFVEAMGHEVDMHTSSKKALEAFKNNPEAYKLVITDHTMPEFSGVELISKIREISSDIHCILTTGTVLEEFESFINSDEHFSYLKKPYKRASLQELLDKFSS